MIALYDYDPMELSPNVDMEVGLDIYNCIYNLTIYIFIYNLIIYTCIYDLIIYNLTIYTISGQVELNFQTGDIITVFGDMDDDGFYMAELRGQRGLVPR